MSMTRRAMAHMPWSMALSLSKSGNLGANCLSPKFICLSPKFTCSSSASPSPRKLILYSKPGCCLCDNLKDKLFAAFSLSDPLYVDFQIRDITTNSEWERAYQYQIPVLAKLRTDGTEETLPRFSPRLGVEAIRQKIVDAFGEKNLEDAWH